MKNFFKNTPSGKIYQVDDYTPSGAEWEKLSAKAGKAAYAEQCRAELKSVLTGGRKVYCNVTKVAASGMSRTIQFYVINGDGLERITPLIAGAADYKLTDDGLRVSGCGMDMCFAVLDSAAGANNLDIRAI